jgi:hypothetical protein
MKTKVRRLCTNTIILRFNIGKGVLFSPNLKYISSHLPHNINNNRYILILKPPNCCSMKYTSIPDDLLSRSRSDSSSIKSVCLDMISSIVENEKAELKPAMASVKHSDEYYR